MLRIIDRHAVQQMLTAGGQKRREGFEERLRQEFAQEELVEFRRALGLVARLMKS